MDNSNDIKAEQWTTQRLAVLLPLRDWQPDTTRGLQLFRDRRERRRMHGTRLVWATICGVIAAIAVMTFPATRILAAHYATACMSLLGRISGEAPGLNYTEVNQRKAAPELAVRIGAGPAAKLSDFRGKVVLLTFWKPGCTACDTENAWFREFQQTWREGTFVFLNHRLAADDDDVLGLFSDRQTIPATLLIDKSGRIAATHAGLCTKREYQTAIESLLNEP